MIKKILVCLISAVLVVLSIMFLLPLIEPLETSRRAYLITGIISFAILLNIFVDIIISKRSGKKRLVHFQSSNLMADLVKQIENEDE